MAKQVGGDHYQGMSIQPWEYTIRRFPGHAEATIIEYVTRWREKNGFEDLRKAISWIEKLIEVETELQTGVAKLPDVKPELVTEPCISMFVCNDCGNRCVRGAMSYGVDNKLVCDRCANPPANPPANRQDVKPEPAPSGVMRCDGCGAGGSLYYRADRTLVCDKCVGLKSDEVFTCARCDAKCNHGDRLCNDCFKLLAANDWLH